MATKFREVIAHDVKFEIIGFRRKFLTVSGFAFVASLVLLFVRGMNFGIDFSGGTEIQVEFSNKVAAERLKQGRILKDLKKKFPNTKYEVQRFGTGRGFLFKFGAVSQAQAADRWGVPEERSAIRMPGNVIVSVIIQAK